MATYYSSRRMASYDNRCSNSAWSSNRNSVRHNAKPWLGPVSKSVAVLFLVAILGILFLNKSSSVTTFDREIASANSELLSLEAERDALAVENAKINARAADESQNEVASNMVTATSAGYVSE